MKRSKLDLVIANLEAEKATIDKLLAMLKAQTAEKPRIVKSRKAKAEGETA